MGRCPTGVEGIWEGQLASAPVELRRRAEGEDERLCQAPACVVVGHVVMPVLLREKEERWAQRVGWGVDVGAGRRRSSRTRKRGRQATQKQTVALQSLSFHVSVHPRHEMVKSPL